MLVQALFLSCCLTTVIGENCNIQLNGVLDALKSVIEYCKENGEYMNLDAAFGLVMGQAQLTYVVSHGDVLEDDLREKIVELKKMIIPVTDAVIENLEPTAKNNLYIPTVLEPEAWMGNMTFKKEELLGIPRSPLEKIENKKAFFKYLNSVPLNEPMSDYCIMAILSQGKRCCSAHTCKVDPDCYMAMGLDDKQYFTPNYGSTHSLLFLQIMKTQKCITEKSLQDDIDKKILQFCSYIYTELEKSKELGFPDELDDVLLEQITLCGYEGYMDFFSKRTISHVLNIQTKDGCFTHADMPITAYIKEGAKRRGKRDAQTLSDGCVNRTTGLAVSALSLILRFLVNLFQHRECSYDESLS